MEKGLIGDFFCGAGGASVGIEEAFGRPVDFAVNHDQNGLFQEEKYHFCGLHRTVHISVKPKEKHREKLESVCFHMQYTSMLHRYVQK